MDKLYYIDESERIEPCSHHLVYETTNTCESCEGRAIDKTWDINGQEINVITCEACKIQYVTRINLEYRVMYCPKCGYNNRFKKYEDRKGWVCGNCHYKKS